MELKPDTNTLTRSFSKLLIVPYGIETQQSGSVSDRIGSLLIVPYGIETNLQNPE